MHILRWLFAHPIIFSWLLAILAILLTTVTRPDKSEYEQKADNEEVAAAAATSQEASEPAAETEAAVEEAEAVKTAGAVKGSAEQSAAEAPGQAADAADKTTDGVKAAAAVTAAATTAVVVAEQSEAEGSAQADTADTEQAQEQVQPEATEQAGSNAMETTAAEQVNETSDQELLLAAREAYWSNDFARAAGFYQDLLARDNRPAYKGELANVLWKHGKSQEAVDLYAEIAVWMKEQGRMAELQNIKIYADLIDPAKGEAIGELLK